MDILLEYVLEHRGGDRYWYCCINYHLVDNLLDHDCLLDNHLVHNLVESKIW